MSKIIASAAIRGAHSIYAKTEAKLARAKESFGAEKAIELPNTGYYLPVIYGLTGEKVEKLSDMDRVLAYAKDLLPEAPSEHLCCLTSAPRSTPVSQRFLPRSATRR
ncbi:MAG: hypothetical protein WCJ13_09580 [Coriobacteriia bacterium]